MLGGEGLDDEVGVVDPLFVSGLGCGHEMRGMWQNGLKTKITFLTTSILMAS